MSIEKAIQVAKFSGDRLNDTYTKYSRFVPAASFGAGIIWDILTLGRIDLLSNIVQIGIYLVLIGILIGVEAIDHHHEIVPPKMLLKVWRYRDELTHFFLGSLLSAFTIFFLKSGTLISSFLFLAIIGGALVVNEFSGVRKYGLILRVVLFSVCLISYCVAVVPVLWGRIGMLQFLISLVVALLLFTFGIWLLRRWNLGNQWLKKRIVLPFATTFVSFAILYAIGAIPPVPLSLTHLGIYRNVERTEGNYRVSFIRPKWKFWQSGDQTFTYRAGERVYCFFSIFSPGGFEERVNVRWLSYSATNGWEKSDAVPVNIAGGRDQGFRGFAYKQAVKPGLWQVRIETNDSREIGRLSFEIVSDESPEKPRETTERIL